MFMALASFMRLSSMKAAHAAVAWGSYRKSGYLARFSRDMGYHSRIFVIFKLLDALSFGFILREREVEVRGIPHLAKNERDMGHPELACRTECKFTVLTQTLKAR
jgi:hypothetical protein